MRLSRSSSCPNLNLQSDGKENLSAGHGKAIELDEIGSTRCESCEGPRDCRCVNDEEDPRKAASLPRTPPCTTTPSVLHNSQSRDTGATCITTTPNAQTPQKKRTEPFRRRRRSSRPVWAPPEVVRSLKDSPEGYPSLAAFLDSDENFMLFRRFGYFQNRLLLEKQARLMELERRIDELDEFLNIAQPAQLRTVQIDDAPNNPGGKNSVERQQLLEQADQVFREYAQLMTAVQQMRSFERPTERDRQSVVNYVWSKKPIVDHEASWIQYKEDLVALRPPKEPDWLEARIAEAITFLGWHFLKKLFSDERSKSKSYDQNNIYYSPSRIANVATAIVAFTMSVILVLPVLLCYVLVSSPRVGPYTGYAGCIGILFLFTLLFACSMAFYSKAKRHEILAATAAYCAVLVVFLGSAAKQRTDD